MIIVTRYYELIMALYLQLFGHVHVCILHSTVT